MQKMLLLIIGTGLIGWTVLDNIESRKLTNIFNEQLSLRFKQQAITDRHQFNEHVKSYSKTLKIVTSLNSVHKYLTTNNWKNKNNKVLVHKTRPEWLPNTSVMRSLIHPRVFMMFDDKMKLWEIYHAREEYLPEHLIKPTNSLLDASNGQSFVTWFDGKPYVVTSENIYDEKRNLLATLLFSSPIDNEFLIRSQGVLDDNIVVILGEDKETIIASSNPAVIKAGISIESMKTSHMSVMDKLFDYGMSSFPINFVSLKSTDEVKSLTKSVIKMGRQEGVIVTAVFVGCFAIILILITRRVENIGTKITEFSRKTLNAQEQKFEKGDQLFVLEQQFQALTQEVVKGREDLRREAAEKILLIRDNVEEKEKQLELLQSTTGVLGVGVIVKKQDGNYEPANDQMERFIESCGDIQLFIPKKGFKEEEHHLHDDNDDERIFNIRNMGELSGETEIYLVQEITELKAKTRALEHQALHDSLTGLPNRALLYERFEQVIRMAQREYKMVALFMMDLDRFKEVNDTLGHHFGDLLLQEVAKRLRYTLRDSDTVARFGGDEFAVLLIVPDEEKIVGVAKKITDSIDKEFIIEGHTISTAISIGISVFPNHGEDPNVLIQRADVAMYVAKQAHTGFSFYDPRQDPHSLNRLSLMGDLRHAIEKDELVPYFQPKIDMVTGKVTGSEALVRWHHETEGFVPPDMFIPIAEQTGLIKQLTYWVVDKAIHQCARWRREGIEVDVSINLSVRNLQDPSLVEYIAKIISMCGVQPEWIVFEITESAIMTSPADARNTLDNLDKMGVGLSIDDFGTGHSSLAYLKQLPVKEIKIDKSFVTDMLKDDNDAVIVRATVDLAHNLGLKVVAEGVETKDVMDMLEILDCDTIQGYYISPPMPADKFTHWFKSSPWGGGDSKGTGKIGNNIRRIK